MNKGVKDGENREQSENLKQLGNNNSSTHNLKNATIKLSKNRFQSCFM